MTVENSGENPETNVKVDVTVTAAGKQFKASHVINSTAAGHASTTSKSPSPACRWAWPRRSKSYVEPVPGETDVENNKATYLAIFGE